MATPQRRATDHVHVEYWTESEQHRYEDRIGSELKGLRADLQDLSRRLTLIIGGIALLAFMLPILSPWIRQLFGTPIP